MTGTSLNSESDGAVDEPISVVLPDDAKLHDMLQESGFNWFEFVSIIEDSFGQIEQKYEALSSHLAPKEKELAAHSHNAFVHVQSNEMPLQE